jgi:hypothetical protein
MDLASKTTRSGGIAKESMSRTLAVPVMLRKADCLDAKDTCHMDVGRKLARLANAALDLSRKPRRRPAPSSEDLEQLSSI